MSASPSRAGMSHGATSTSRHWRAGHPEGTSEHRQRDDGWRRREQDRDRDDWEGSSSKGHSYGRQYDRSNGDRDDTRRRDRYRDGDYTSRSYRREEARGGDYRSHRPSDNGWANVKRDRRPEDRFTDRYYDDRPRSQYTNGKGKDRDAFDGTDRDMRIRDRTPDDEDDEARERRLRRLKRRRRSAGLSSDGNDDDRIEAIYSRRQEQDERDDKTAIAKGSTHNIDDDGGARRPPNDLKRRLSAREIVEDDSHGDDRLKDKRRDRSDHSRRSRRSSELSPIASRRRRDRSPDASDRHDRRRRPSSPDRHSRGGRSDIARSPTLSQRLDIGASSQRSEGEGGIRIAGSSARRRNGHATHRSPSPEVKLLRRRGTPGTETTAPSEPPPSARQEARPDGQGRDYLGDVDMQVLDKVAGKTDELAAVHAKALIAPRGRPDEIYERIAQVGEGTYGQVFKARSDRTGVIVALKKIRMEGERDGFPITAMREIKLLQGLRHENVVLLHEIMLSRNSVYMVFEYLQHDLNGVLSQGHINFTQAHLKSLAAQLLSGLGYLHQHSILHRDLKCSNLLLNNDGTLKLADFGLARLYTKRARAPKQRSLDYTNRVVTLWYRAPELLFGETNYSDAIDVWGAGCIFLELFTRKPVFQGNDEIHQVQLLFEILGPITPAQWPEADDLPWYDLVRPSTSGADKNADTFGRSFASLMPPDALEVARALLSYSPLKRISARDALALPYFAQNAPAALKPAALLQSVEGEWHEFESRRAKRDADVRALHAQVHRDRATAEQQKQSSRSSRGTHSHEHTQPTPEIRTTGRTDPMLTDKHDDGNASA